MSTPTETAPALAKQSARPAQSRARHDPGDNAQVIADTFARVLPTLRRATALLTPEQRAFLHDIAKKKRVDGWASFFIDAALTEADGLLLRRALLSIPDHFALEVNHDRAPLHPEKP